MVLANDVHTEEEYLRRATARPGAWPHQGPEAAGVGDARRPFTEGLRRDGMWTFLDPRRRGGTPGRGRAPTPPFRHVVVDEIQDLHPAQWRLLRAAVPVGPDDLFLTGDPHQRIYGNHVSLRSVGISVPAGRAGCGSTTARARRSCAGRWGCSATSPSPTSTTDSTR